MKRWLVVVVLATMLAGWSPAPVQASAAADAALALGAFAVFNQLIAWPWYYHQRVVVAPPYYDPYYGYPPVVYAPRTVYAAPAPPAIQREVVYPHGRYVLLGDGVTQAYQWAWVPNPPPPPAPPAPPAASAPPVTGSR